MNYWFDVNLGGGVVFLFNQLMVLLLPIAKNLLRLCTREEKLFQYWYLALKISQYFVSIYWFCSKGFITLLIIASKHKHLVSRIRHNIMKKLMLLLMVAQSQLKYL